MDINAAECALARHVARQSGLALDQTVLCGNGGVVESPPMVRVRFVSGKLAATALAEFVAEVHGVFAEPEEAHAFAAAVWGKLPRYGDDGFTELAADDDVKFEEQEGAFTATGRIKACFA